MLEVRGRDDHSRAVEQIRTQYAAIPPGAPVRLAKRTSNLFRARTATAQPGLDVSGLDDVIAIDPAARRAVVQGMTTYERLVEVTLEHGLMPLVVPQLRTITLGGAVTGLGIESSSFRDGLPHESVLAMDILTGDGQVVTATPDGEHADLYHGFPNSYGSLGYAMSLTIELAPVAPWVALTHQPFTGPGAIDLLTAAIATIMSTAGYAGQSVDFVDGVVFSRTEAYLTLGRWQHELDAASRPSDYTGSHIYYRSIQQRSTDLLTTHDYLWRWDTDWFWCSRAFGAQNPIVRRLWPRNRLRSDEYWKLVALDRRFDISGTIDRMRGNGPRERVVQDVEVPLERTAEFLDFFLREIPIEPIWLCPIQLRAVDASGQPRTAGSAPWPLYPMRVGEPYVNVGFWSSVPVSPASPPGEVNRRIEEKVERLGGHKSLYSESFYARERFDRLYDAQTQTRLRDRYDPLGRLPTLFDKAVRSR